MKRFISIIVLVLSLTACEDMSDVTASTLDEMHEWMYGEPRTPAEPEVRVLESRYCYSARADIVCYDTPQPGREDTLVGVQ